MYPDGETAPVPGREQADGADQLETIESSPEVYTPEQETPRRSEGRVRGRTPPLPPGSVTASLIGRAPAPWAGPVIMTGKLTVIICGDLRDWGRKFNHEPSNGNSAPW